MQYNKAQNKMIVKLYFYQQSLHTNLTDKKKGKYVVKFRNKL